jgi:alanine-glyoxylate transaminase/serine-glyoxylate transaminase/serine-pyruvate transaminase
MMVATLAGVEMGLKKSSIPHKEGGVQTPMSVLG